MGGIKEKLLAARRSGIQNIIFPGSNKKDYDELNGMPSDRGLQDSSSSARGSSYISKMPRFERILICNTSIGHLRLDLASEHDASVCFAM